jgi:hypothetical protein
MLGKVFARFVEQSPISVMVRGTLERVLGADQLDAWFARTAQKQYTRTVGIRLRRDSLVSVRYAEELNSTTSSVTLQRTDRHGILGQKSSHLQVSL